MNEWIMKRFWSEAQASDTGAGFDITLDGRAIKTPAKAPLSVPTRALAEAIVAEWNAVDKQVDFFMMPMTRAANTTIDKVAHQRNEVADIIAAYGDTDLLCYRATAPEELVQRQAEGWDPLLDRADSELRARLVPVTGVTYVSQDPAALESLRLRVHAQNDFILTALHDLVALSGSLIIGLAVLEGWQPPETLWELSRIDETWQAELWGNDIEAQKVDEIKRAAFLHAKEFFTLVRGEAT